MKCECQGWGHKPKAKKCDRGSEVTARVYKLGLIPLAWDCYDRLHQAGLAPVQEGEVPSKVKKRNRRRGRSSTPIRKTSR